MKCWCRGRPIRCSTTSRRLNRSTVRHYGLFYDHGWFIDFHTIERAINERTRAIVLVNPNNPTGHFLRRHELAQLSVVRAADYFG